MLEIYLGNNKRRNKALLESLEKYGVFYQAHHPSDITRDTIYHFMRYSPDCFDFLSPVMLRFKRSEDLKTSDLVTIIMRHKIKYLKLPIIIHNKKVYADVSSDDLRMFIPRRIKQDLFRQALRKDLEE